MKRATLAAKIGNATRNTGARSGSAFRLVLLVAAALSLGAAPATKETANQDVEKQKQVCTDIREAVSSMLAESRETSSPMKPTNGLVTLSSLPAWRGTEPTGQARDVDPWGRPYLVYSDGRGGLLVVSTGKDSRPDKPYDELLTTGPDPQKTLETLCEGADPGPGADILYVNARFCKLSAEAIHGKPGVPFTEIDRQKVTMSDMRSIATAIEEYAIDNDVYPVLTRGTAPLTQLRLLLTPTYIRILPNSDAWGDPFLYWSNGDRYLVVSQNKGLDRDYAAYLDSQKDIKAAFAELCGGGTTRPGADILFTDGQFCQYPAAAVADESAGQ